MTRMLFVALGVMLGMPAFAQDANKDATSQPETDETGRQIKYKERTEIDFEGVDVTGELVKPQGQLLLDRRRAQFNPLIKLRDNWNDEMKQSVDEIK
jgi:hypothetical protein